MKTKALFVIVGLELLFAAALVVYGLRVAANAKPDLSAPKPWYAVWK